MPITTELVEVSRGVLNTLNGGVAVTYAQQGGNTKAIPAASVIRTRYVRGVEGTSDRDTCTFQVKSGEFASGFNLTNPANPGAGDTVTISGEGAWTVGSEAPGDAAVSIEGAVHVLRCSRERLRGTA